MTTDKLGEIIEKFAAATCEMVNSEECLACGNCRKFKADIVEWVKGLLPEVGHAIYCETKFGVEGLKMGCCICGKDRINNVYREQILKRLEEIK
jgi:hypothetical protein